jgi:hypothetical protein
MPVHLRTIDGHLPQKRRTAAFPDIPAYSAGSFALESEGEVRRVTSGPEE